MINKTTEGWEAKNYNGSFGKCEWCGQDNLIWRYRDFRWVLVNVINERRHACKVIK